MAHRRTHRRRRNPGLGQLKATLPTALWAIGGGAGASTIPGFLPATFSAGWMGVLTIAGGALLLSMAAEKVGGTKAGEGVLIGGLVAAGLRAITLATGKSFGGFTSLRGYGPYSFPLPSTTGSGPLQLPASVAANGAAGMGRRARGAW